LKSVAVGGAGEFEMNIQHSTFNIQRSSARSGFIGRLVLNVECWMFLFFCSAAPALFAQTNSEATNALLQLSPPLDELPPTFLEEIAASGSNARHLGLFGVALIILVLIGIWLIFRRKPRVIPPEVQARQALGNWRQSSEDGACVSNISQIVRKYFIAAFELPSGELTTTQFCCAIESHSQIGSELSTAVVNFLRECDERKFSLVNPSAPLGAMNRALKLVALGEARRAQLRQLAETKIQEQRA
jgi:hypothetical protein